MARSLGTRAPPDKLDGGHKICEPDSRIDMDNRSGDMAVFAKVVETGGFSSAGKVLGLTPSAVSKLVARLERRLGVQLVQRSTRQLAVTPEGRDYYDSCVRILADIDEAEQGLVQDRIAPHGLVRVSMSVGIGTRCVLPLMPEFRARYPEITLDLSLTDARVDLQRERVDVGLRVGPLADATFRARPLGRSRRAVVAAPAYLERHGVPRVPSELCAHECFNFNFKRSLDEWPFLVDGRAVHLAVRGHLLTNNGETARAMALQGLGIARLGWFHVSRDLAEGRLVEVLREYLADDVEEIHAIFSNQRHMPLRVRVFIDFLAERLGAQLAAM